MSSTQEPITGTSQVLDKGLWGMTRPMLLEQALVLSIPMTDLFFLSRVSDNAAAAVGAITPILYFSFTCLWVVAFAGSSLTSQRMGTNDYGQANTTIGVYGIWLVLLSMLATAMVFHGGPVVSGWMGLELGIKVDADTYLRITAWMIGIWGVHALTHSILTVYGLPHWNLIANSAYFVSNVLGNSCVVFGLFGLPKLGLIGVAWVSVFSSLIGVLVALFAIYWRLKLSIVWANVRRDFKRHSRQLGRIALPSIAEPLSFDAQMIVLSAIVAVGGATELAARAYTFNTFMALLIFTIAISTATEVLVGQRVGAKQFAKANRQLHQSLKAALFGACGLGITLTLFAPQIMSLYTNDNTILTMAYVYFGLSVLTEPGRTTNIIVGNSLRGTGDGWFISIAGLLFSWCIAVPLAWYFAIHLDMGLIGVLISALIDESCRSLIYYRRWRQGHWQHKNAIAMEEAQQRLNQTGHGI
ncbi:MATE family efflux transporter [Simiduia aestuariiviva]|uniref:Putative MATE family efflux protein n=1 Tax=Simiduia aestuariiviva TaxID=1510459 RepID=A0A839UPW1_9GAMM|nr:MATE family efflux transporter [Simiduia aestuariiviva]MBB3167568.1 putative MATE family efflux protein [Simiduia aestuariiviva]